MYINDPIAELVDRILWPKIDDVNAARKVARQGAYYAFFRAGAYALSVTLQLIRPNSNLLRAGAAAYVLESATFFVLGFLIFRLSRAAAVIGLIFYLTDFAISILRGHFRGIVIPLWIVFVLFFINSVRGTYAHRRLTQESATSRN
jgi:hypothetical protein